MILIDAGYLVGLIDPRDELHGRAIAWSRSVGGDMVITDHVLVEAINFFSATAWRVRMHDVTEMLLQSSGVELLITDARLLEEATTLHRNRPDKAWSLTDCISFVVMQGRGIRKALAYDHHFEQAGYEALLRRDPG